MSLQDWGLPHREPFIFIDEVVAQEPGRSATCRKTFPPEQDFFRGHFPGDPLVPGVILTEALAQTAGLAAGQPGTSFHLAAIRSMKFTAPVRPGDAITLHAEKSGGVGGMWQFAVSARVGDALVAEGSIILSAVPAPPLP